MTQEQPENSDQYSNIAENERSLAEPNPLSPISKVLTDFGKVIQELGKVEKIVEESIRKQMICLQTMIKDTVAYALKNLPENTRDASRYVAEKGWYLEPEIDMSIVVDILAFKKTADDPAIDEHMMQLSRKLAERIINDAIKDFPQRQHILCEAFSAHKEGRYALSVPIFLAQSDGMAFDKFGKYLFTGITGDISNILDAFPRYSLAYAFWEGFCSKIGVRASFSPKGDVPNLLNRHAVLHGRDLDYPSEKNSLKSIMLLGCLRGLYYSLHNKQQCSKKDYHPLVQSSDSLSNILNEKPGCPGTEK